MLWKLKRKSLAALSKFLRWCSDCINEYLWRDAEIVWNKAAEQPLAPDGAVCPAHQTYFEADGTCAIAGCKETRPAGKA